MSGANMAQLSDTLYPDRSRKTLFGPVSAGFITGLTAAAGMLLSGRLISSATVGRGHPLKHRMLDAAASAMQRKYPLEAMSTYLDGFHMYAHAMGRQVEATHFCTHLRHDLHQCVIFDSNRPDARLIGIEYIISEERFRNLPDDEKRLWHSHHYEVKSGTLVALGIPELAERAYFKDLVTTYGKTFHTWQYDRDDFPYGIPQLMMGFTEDGQVDNALVEARDRRFCVSPPAPRGINAPTPRCPASRRRPIPGKAAERGRPAWRKWISGDSRRENFAGSRGPAGSFGPEVYACCHDAALCTDFARQRDVPGPASGI